MNTVCACTYLHHSVKPRDGVHLGSFRNQFALNFISHRLNGVCVRADEGHALVGLVTDRRRDTSHIEVMGLTRQFVERRLGSAGRWRSEALGETSTPLAPPTIRVDAIKY